MNTLKGFLMRLFRRIWNVNLIVMNEITIIEVTDPSYLWANLDNLFNEVIETTFKNYTFMSISQFVDQNQWVIPNLNGYLKDLTNDNSYPIVLSKSFSTITEANLHDALFIINIVGPTKKSWFNKIIRFSMTNNPNILYGLTVVPENWFLKVVEWNSYFYKWFNQEKNFSIMKEVLSQVDLICWTEDGHLNIVSGNIAQTQKIMLGIRKIAEKNDFIFRVNRKDPLMQ